jgi:branched-chain amino acid transport system permease protein
VVLLIQLVSGLAVGCIYGLLAIGFSMIYRASGLVNFAQGDVMMVGAFLGYSVLAVAPGLPFWAVVLVAAVATSGVGLLIERIAIRQALARHAGQMQLVLLTLGIGIVLSNTARLVWGANPVVYAIPLSYSTVMVAGYPLPTVSFYIFAAMAALLAALHVLFTRTWLGLALRAAADDATTAAMLGVSTGTVSSASFAIASGIGGMAGVLFAPIFYVSFDMGLIGIKAFAAAIVGSLGSIPGAVLGGLVIGLGETFGGQVLGPEYQDSIAFAVMIAVLLFRPTGLLWRAK